MNYKLLIINLSYNDFSRFIPVLKSSLKKEFQIDKPIILLNKEMEIDKELCFEVEFPFYYININGAEYQSKGFIYSQYIGNKKSWVITTSGIEFAEMVTAESIVSKDSVQNELIFKYNKFYESNLVYFYQLINSILSSGLNILSMRFVEAEAVLKFPYACDLVFHKSPFYFLQDIIDSAKYIRKNQQDIKYYSEYRDISIKSVNNLIEYSISLFDKMNALKKERKKVEEKIIAGFYQWYSNAENRNNLYKQEENGILIGNLDFSTTGPLQNFYDYLLRINYF